MRVDADEEFGFAAERAHRQIDAGALNPVGIGEQGDAPVTLRAFPDEARIVDASTMADASRVLAAGFGMPSEAVTAAFPPALVDVSGFTVVLALVDGEPAASAACSVDEDLVGIYNVATAPEHRGRGLGTAVTWAAIAVGAADRGPTAAVLQASSAGAPVYERMGFVTRDRYRQLEGGV